MPFRKHANEKKNYLCCAFSLKMRNKNKYKDALCKGAVMPYVKGAVLKKWAQKKKNEPS